MKKILMPIMLLSAQIELSDTWIDPGAGIQGTAIRQIEDQGNIRG